MSDNTGGDVAYSATYNFNPAGDSTSKTSISFVYRQPVARRQRPRYCYANSYCNHYAERYSYRYAKADAHAAIRADTEATSHTGAETVMLE